MSELLKVLKFVCRRMLMMFSLIKYKGLYAFLCGIMVLSVCFSQISTLNARSVEDTAEQKEPLLSALSAAFSAEKSYLIFDKAAKVRIMALSAEPDTDFIADNAETEPEPENVEENSNGEIRYVNKDGIYSREEGVEGAAKVKQYSLNETVVVVETTETDYCLLDDGSFIHSDYLSETETPKWIEEPADGTLYVNKEGIYSREEAVEGSQKIKQYSLNEKVTVSAKTDTEYYKLDNGEFIHSDYLSETETPKWIEIPDSGIMYVSKNGIYSREEGVEGSKKVEQYSLNDTVTVTASTDTGYYKLSTGEFIHSDYLSPVEIVEYPLSVQYGQRAQTDWEKELARQVFDIVNSLRAEYGLQPLKQLDSLTAAAAERAWETTFYNSHTRPDGTSCFSILNKYGLGSPSAKAENIAMWNNSAQAVVNSWMRDYAHRSAILGDYEYMGVGCYYIDGDYYKYYWTQMFYTP